MKSWRDSILKDFIPHVSRLTLVADPDCLLTEEKMGMELRDRGFELIEFNDPVEFRYAYESRFRSIWDRGEHTDLVVILRLDDADLESLPYDLLQAGRQLAFNLGDLFPSMSYPVIEKLDRTLLDKLFDAQHRLQPERMGDRATKDFILRHVFGIAPELITEDVALFHTLLRLHYGKVRMPEELADRLIEILKNDAFRSWPLSEVVPDDKAFFAFLQERWPVFLAGIKVDEHGIKTVSEKLSSFISEPLNLLYSGPAHLPFGHQDIRIYIDNLFLEGKLSPIEAQGMEADAGSWIRSGIVIPGHDDTDLRFSRLFELIEKEWPTAETRHSGWIAFALKWAELSSLVHCSCNESYQARLHGLGDTLNLCFASWLDAHYSGLSTLPPTQPAMLHHVPRRLAQVIEVSAKGRIALLVVDGLPLDQWVSIRPVLQAQNNHLLMRESAVFAWIPTLTSVSRQAVFSGKPPIFFPTSIHSTGNEEKLWKQFWENHGISRQDVVYQRGLGDGDVSALLEDLIHPGKTRVVGLVVDKVDKIMHGMQLGSAGMHNQIRQWCQHGFLATLIDRLQDDGYEVWLTSDHGNIQCEGRGRPSEGAIAETRGERVRVYPTPELRYRVAESFPFAHEWKPTGLPSGYFPLIAGGRDAFVRQGDKIVGHGGASIEEVIVPLIKFERKTS
ncbi:PglZ domain-containing protein [Desulfobotulus alkaliphilus]|uniref:PglZ domain-containing protein n=1 Tax=Desulfobotulus alkaliphilus TaxID=622671 RepID=A0A562S0E4_9BACT|nr:BREX-3 system phosphatase PglZ [Desulfobotulus alkaliphilus]TWI73970.1 PglZ domain-containing protein [Desulfobotulus alkaliphilus]